MLWLTSGVILAYFQMPPLPTVRWHTIPLPTWMVVGGIVGGLLLAAIGRGGVELGARTKARMAESHLTDAIGDKVLAQILPFAGAAAE